MIAHTPIVPSFLIIASPFRVDPVSRDGTVGRGERHPAGTHKLVQRRPWDKAVLVVCAPLSTEIRGSGQRLGRRPGHYQGPEAPSNRLHSRPSAGTRVHICQRLNAAVCATLRTALLRGIVANRTWFAKSASRVTTSEEEACSHRKSTNPRARLRGQIAPTEALLWWWWGWWRWWV
jgi:hypothetical protein